MFKIRTTVKGNQTNHPYFEKLNITDAEVSELESRRAAGEKVSIPEQVSTLACDIPVDADAIFSKLSEDVLRRLAMAQLKIKMRAPAAELVEQGGEIADMVAAIENADYSSEGRARMSDAEKAVRMVLATAFGKDTAEYEAKCVAASKKGWDKVLAALKF